jgi:hypothetical protein
MEPEFRPGTLSAKGPLKDGCGDKIKIDFRGVVSMEFGWIWLRSSIQ